MGVELFDDTEIVEIELFGSVFKIKRMTYADQLSATYKNTNTKGVLDFDGLTMDTVKKCVVGWENVSHKGKPVKFDPERIRDLPPEVGNALYLGIEKISKVDKKSAEKDLKNSGSVSTTK